MKKHTVWKNNLKFSGMNRVKSPPFEAQCHILKTTNNKAKFFFCLSLGLQSSVPAWCLCCQRATIPTCVMGLPWLWASAVQALGTRWGPERSTCGRDCSCFLLPQTHLCANMTHADGFLTHVHYQPAGVQHYFEFFNFSRHGVSFPACTEQIN